LEALLVNPVTYFVLEKDTQLPVQQLRILRLLRLTRMARLVRSVPELVAMTYGLAAGIRACASAVFMNIIMIYAFGIALLAILKNDGEANYEIRRLSLSDDMHCERLLHCMWLLLVDGTLLLDGTGTVLTNLVWSHSASTTLAGLIFVLFVFISALVICNMLIGVLCEVLAKVTQSQKNLNDFRMLKDTVLQHLQQHDDGDGMLSSSEFESVMHEPESKALLKELNVDRAFMVAMQKMFEASDDEVELPIQGILEMLLACRADTPATVQTVASSLSYVTFRLEALENHMDKTFHKGMANLLQQHGKNGTWTD
jgi:hypothetical protein